jgi:hypothetical protein
MRRVDFSMEKWDRFLDVNTAADLAIVRALAPRPQEDSA